jgi:CBS domain-containing protein
MSPGGNLRCSPVREAVLSQLPRSIGTAFAFEEVEPEIILSTPQVKRHVMRTATKPLTALTAGDLMVRDVVTLREDMPLETAAHLLLQHQIGGAPVVDGLGKCVGVLSAMDILRLTEKRDDITQLTAPALPVTCSFQRKHKKADGQEVTRCLLPLGVCPIQEKQRDFQGEPLLVCTQPHCVLFDWQVVDLEKLPKNELRQFMTADPVTVDPATSIRVLARMMIDAHIHRLIVVDEEQRPIGVVSSFDLLAGLAFGEGEG